MSSKLLKELTAGIREEASRLGFLKLGIAPAGPLPDGERFMQWLGEGRHGAIGYLERQAPKRLNPALVLKGARSILILAQNYYSDRPPSDLALKGRISRYAWGDDYHPTLKTRLGELLSRIRKMEPAVQGVCYADTGPIMEKVWGAQTSLGWMGKNTLLISQECGSWFFTGVILINIELEYDFKALDHCGQCKLCLQSCPSGAIIAPYILDTRLCISHLSQSHGPIARPLRPVMGNRIFGCDACQEVCPWNRCAPETAEKGFHPREENLAPDLKSLAGISADEFRERFKNSPVGQATRDVIVRNVMVALGNSRSLSAIPILEKALADVSPMVRAHAAWALGQIAGSRAPEILERARMRETDPDVLEEINLVGQQK
jgi:epoxyqueuosine reductase